MERLREFGLADYFLWPQINWNPKSDSIKEIATRLSLGLDTFAFVDDQPFELAEVAFAHPKVLCIDAAELAGIPGLKRPIPRFITDESKIRRKSTRATSDDRKPNASSPGPTRSSWRAREHDLHHLEGE